MANTYKKFGDMTGGEKIVFLVKLTLFICTFGFAFPLVLHSEEYVAKYH